MKRSMGLILLLILVCGCGREGRSVRKTAEDGVEIVLNTLNPENKEGKLLPKFSFSFEIDSSNLDIAEMGLSDIGTFFDADEEGNLFLINPRNPEAMVFVFDKQGQFVRSFGRRGQGPGEILGGIFSPTYICVDNENRLLVTDQANSKLIRFDGTGRLIDEQKIEISFRAVEPLPGNHWLVWKILMDREADNFQTSPLLICDSTFEPIKKLDEAASPNPMKGKRYKLAYYDLDWVMAGERIFSGFSERGYEIRIFDLEGRPVRRIRMEHRDIPVNEERESMFLPDFSGRIFDSIRNKVDMPKFLPPFHTIIADEKGRLLVAGYEDGDNPGEFLYDVFDEDGEFLGRVSLPVLNGAWEFSRYALIKNNRLYLLAKNQDDYKVLKVYDIEWP